ncbi:MAG: Translation initiation factor 3 subunit J component [Caeruleum heppii]|nr:MAG: Translation initiation factor 3 subunit J component [Caeruleum heppii]
MAPAKAAWDEEDDSSTPPSSPPTVPTIARRSKFDDEEDDSDVLESWDAAEDSEAEAEKAKKAAEAKAKVEAEAAANKKSKAQRIAERRDENIRRRQAEEEETSSDEEDEASKRERLRRTEQDADLKHAEDLFGNIGISNKRSAVKPTVLQNPNDPDHSIDVSALPLFTPTTKDGFTKLREALVPILNGNAKKAHYTLFLQDLTKQLAKELPSDQIKKIASGLTTLSNEKMKEEKAAEKGGKKSKAAKTKTSLVAGRDTVFKADTTAYEDGLDDGDDFM